MRLRPSRTLRVEPSLPEALEPLRQIAANLYWTWNTDAAELFQQMDRARWEESGHNPVRVLQTMPPPELRRLSEDPQFLAHLRRVDAGFREYIQRPPQMVIESTSSRSVIAYFSLEFALTESLPVYSGGLGVLAGDHLKSASDLGLPLVGVGLLYRQGYFQQALGPDGWQREEYQEIDLSAQPLTRVRDAAGPLTVTVPIDGRQVSAAVWRLEVGTIPLYLLSTDVEANTPGDRAITERLYGGDIETRIQQEMLLGIGGVRALHAMDLHPAVCHMNEGHSALLGVDRIRMLMEETGCSFAEARLPVTAATVFTTHTAVAAGIDLFPPELVRKYLGPYYSAMGLDDRTFIGFGRTNPDDEHEPFSMALLGLRLSCYRNAVSKLHRTVSQKLWESAWPNLPREQVPIDAITNGVHLPTWVAHELGELYDASIGRRWRDDPVAADSWRAVEAIPDRDLWAAHGRQRERLVVRARQQHRESATRRGVGENGSALVLDPEVLTIGFARRFAGYKRATLLFRDSARLARIVNHPERPVQFIFAGKAHPRDEPAKQLIREVVEHSRRPEFRGRLVILERYDVELARALVQGCDVWLNTPLRPLEASGTSGMKAVANGSLHLSVLDGWWAEAYRPGFGWAIGRDRTDDDPEVQDAFDADSLYDLLENEVSPLFYNVDADGVPRGWVAQMKGSIAAYAPKFNTNRMVGDYATRAYAPAARCWRQLVGEGGKGARRLAEWLGPVTAGWDSFQVLAVQDTAGEVARGLEPIQVTVQARPGQLAEQDVRLDIVHGALGSQGELVATGESAMALQGRADGGVLIFAGAFTPVQGGQVGYAIRVMPTHPDLHNAFATGLVRWA